MSLIKKIFGERPLNDSSQLNWISLTTINQFEELMYSGRTIGIFKHSTRCIVSSMVKKQLERNFNLSSEQIEMYYLDLISNRDISNGIAKKLNIAHESPQLILLKGNSVLAHASHQSISNLDLEEFV